MNLTFNYLTVANEDIPETLQHANASSEVEHCPVDELWSFLKGIKVPDTNSFQFYLLFWMAEVAMAIPNSNAAEEHIFSMINKYETSCCNFLCLSGTLLFIMLVKTYIDIPL